MNLQFFNMISPVGKILHLANYDLKNNFKNWFYLLSMQAMMIAVLFLYRYLPGAFIISFPDIFFGVGNFQFVLGEEYFSLAWNVTSVLMCIKVAMAMLSEYCFHILFPIMILQNALDLAFDSTMRGYAVKGPMFIYVVVVHAFFLCRNLILNNSDALMRNMVSTVELSGYTAIGLYAVFCIVALIVCAYFFQILRFVGLHLFEYNEGIKKSIQASLQMTRGNILFLSMISMIQILVIVGMSIANVYITKLGMYMLDGLLSIMPLSLSSINIYSFVLLSLNIVFSALFWSLLMTWYYLIEAHAYRQLVSPAAEKPTCESCECGS